MVNEVIMYQSMFLLGIIAFGFFSLTFNNFTDAAEDLSFESNVEIVTQEIGQVMMDIIAQGRSMISNSDSLEISIPILTLSQFSGKIYEIRLDSNADGEAILISSEIGSITSISEFKTGLVNESQVTFDNTQSLVSTSPNQSIVYNWDRITDTEIVSFRRV